MITERMIQALGAALSRRDWHATEVAYAQLRDAEFEARTKAIAETPTGPEPLPGWVLMPLSPTKEVLHCIGWPSDDCHKEGVEHVRQAGYKLEGQLFPAVYEMQQAFGLYRRLLALAPPPPVEPVRYLQTLHMEDGKTQEWITLTRENGFGIVGAHYSSRVTIEPLFRYPPAAPAAPASQPSATAQEFAHNLLGEFCACYAEAWHAPSCDVERDRLVAWLEANPPPCAKLGGAV